MVSPPSVPPGRRDPDDAETDPTGIRALLGSLPDPGPMPPDLVARIQASIAAEQSSRADSTVVPLERRRRWGWRQAGAVAAAVAVVGVGVPALLSSLGTNGVVASLSGGASSAESDSAASGQAPAASAATTSGPGHGLGSRASAAVGPVTLTASGTAYTASSLPTQAQGARDSATPREQAAKPAAGPATTSVGLRSCLGGAGVEAWMPVWGDVATYEGRPAVVAMVSDDTGQVVYAVEPTCDATHHDVLAGPLPLP